MALNTVEGLHGHLIVLDLDEKCEILQDIPIGFLDKPHEISLDEDTGDIYLANLGTPSSVMKFQRQMKK